MGKGYVIVEGHGESDAVSNLLYRLQDYLGLTQRTWARPSRGKNLLKREGLHQYSEAVRARGDAEALVVLVDDEDGCPKTDGPEMASWLRALSLPFPAAVVLAFREYESLFLPCIPVMAGQTLKGAAGQELPGLVSGARWVGDYEAKRGVKEWLTSQMPRGRSYKPTVDQLPMTRMVDFNLVRQAGLPWFGTLERALRFIDAHSGQPREVYPR